MFDYKGYSEEKLLELCDDAKANRGKADWLYWTPEVYSFGRHYRKYAFYPSSLPLHIYSEHGVGNPKIYPHELENNAEAFFVFCEEKCKEYRKISKKPCYITTPPMILYRRRHKIKQSKDAKGTIAFPSHSTPEVDSNFDIKKYIDDLKSLPQDMQPVCVCLHMHDINKGQHKIFLENNIPVYTAGNAFDVRYGRRFYNILKNFKYSCSNLVGSYTYYSVEMGIPFSLFGQDCEYINKADKNLPVGKYDFKSDDIYKKTQEIFKGINKEISKEQIEFIEKFTSPKGAVSRLKMSLILWGAYFKNGNIIKDIVRNIKNKNKGKMSMFKKIKKVLKLKRELKQLKISFNTAKKLLKAGYGPIKTKLFGKQINVDCAFWYIHGLKELFIENTYKFNTDKQSPKIIDCGSNVGLSIIYFKRLFPNAKITGFEPDKNLFNILKQNLKTFGYSDVELINKAVYTKNGTIKFLASGNVGGRICDEESKDTTELDTARLQDFLNEEIDFLKIDIEGAEYDVIMDCKTQLKNVKNLFIEYHSLEKNEQKLDEILKVVKEAGFKYYIKEAWQNQTLPFVNKRENLFDLQLNIFCYRID